MKRTKKFAAFAAATAVALTLTSSVFADKEAATDSKALAYEATGSEEAAAPSYTKPMSSSTTSKRYKAFKAAKPEKIKFGYDYWDEVISWEPVEDAMLYYVYYKNDASYSLAAKTATPSYYIQGHYGEYYVRAVTYTYGDKRVMSKKSDVIEAVQTDYWYDDGDEAYAEDDDADDAGDAYFDSAPSVNTVAAVAADTATEELTDEEYTNYSVDGFKKASDTPLSTFSADVDTASYANVRRLATDGYTIPADAVRIEEFLNYFDYKYQQPKKNFTLTYEYTDCPWNSKAKLLMMGVQTKDLETEPNSNLVFLIDVSGSMYSKDKLPLVKEALKKLVNETTKKDRISIVTYSGAERVLVSGARGNMVNCITDLADSLEADGVTNGERGINMAYEIAAANYIKNGSNRVIMATDGDLNVGISDPDKLSKFIAEKRDSGVYLTVLGFGTGNLKDNRMEALAKDGNGNYHYIDCAAEATKVLVDERKQTLITVADDVKLQVEFNPTLVDSYRLIGYDGRKLNNEDFTDDKKDAADMGAGQSVTVMYEIIPTTAAADTLKYQSSTGNKTDICTLKIRYKKPGESSSKQSTFTIKASSYVKFADAGIRCKFASCVAETAMALRSDTSYGSVSIKRAYNRFKKLDKTELSTIGYSDDFAQVLSRLIET